jgi:hypothetical protein
MKQDFDWSQVGAFLAAPDHGRVIRAYARQDALRRCGTPRKPADLFPRTPLGQVQGPRTVVDFLAQTVPAAL